MPAISIQIITAPARSARSVRHRVARWFPSARLRFQPKTAIGGIAGGIAGSQIGGGNTAHLLGAVGGAILGGFAGNAAQEGLTSQQGYEYIVRLDNGNTVSTTQGADVLLNPGQRCQIIFGNPARIIPN